MPDICAAVGLAQIRRYPTLLLPERRRIFERYNSFFGARSWAELPPFDNAERTSSYHLYPLRIRNISESQRDAMIQLISEQGVGVNVHYIPMPMLSLFKELGYRMADYPQTYLCYLREISLPIYNGLTEEQVDYVAAAVEDAYWKVK
jgi:dTDP-4-amino-4,6-dideoxygalactose transaminase